MRAIVNTIVSDTVVVVSPKHAILLTIPSPEPSTPASTVRKDGFRKFGISKLNGRAAIERDVIVAPVPDGSICHAVGGESHHGANDCAGDNVVPVVELVNGQRTADKHSAEDRGVDDDQLPHARVIVGENLELGVEVQVKVDKSAKGCGSVAGGERLKAVIDGVCVARANVAREHDLLEAGAVILVLDEGNVRLAYGEEVRAQATDEPLEEDLEDRSGDKRVQDADDGIVGVPKRSDANLHAEDDEDGDQDAQHSSSPNGNDLFAQGVGKLRVNDLAVGKGHGERPGRSWVSFINLGMVISLAKAE